MIIKLTEPVTLEFQVYDILVIQEFHIESDATNAERASFSAILVPAYETSEGNLLVCPDMDKWITVEEENVRDFIQAEYQKGNTTPYAAWESVTALLFGVLVNNGYAVESQ